MFILLFVISKDIFRLCFRFLFRAHTGSVLPCQRCWIPQWYDLFKVTVHCSFSHRFCLILQFDHGNRILYNIRHKHMYTCIIYLYGSPSFIFSYISFIFLFFLLRFNVFYTNCFAVFSENYANAVIHFFICTAKITSFRLLCGHVQCPSISVEFHFAV